MTEGDDFARLAALAGVIPSYRDAWGEERRVSEATQRTLLSAMGFDTSSAGGIAAALSAIGDEPWRNPLPPVLVVRRARRRIPVALTLPAAAGERTIEWRLEEETGRARTGRARFGDLPLLDRRDVNGTAMERRAIELPAAVPLGYHVLRFLDGDHSMSLIVAPRRGHLPKGNHFWGVGVQLYGLRSPGNWGIGDFSDLARLIGIAAKHGADALGLNPLHALFPGDAHRFSPYSPSDRRFVSFLYIDIEAVPEFTECTAAQDLMRDPEFRHRLDAARAAPLVDYGEVSSLKLRALDLLYRSFRERHLGIDPAAPATERGAAFRRFQVTGGDALRRFATFQALSERFGADKSWRDWPGEFRDAGSDDVAAFAAREVERVEFYEYLQWLAGTQLDAAAQMAGNHMAVGLYHDLALGADADGAESWISGHLLAEGIRIGAPPDDWNLKGQNWGLPAYNPVALRAAAYAPFIEMLRANMRHGGALRIDHVMGLERLFWIPLGGTAQDGGYVRYPVDDLMGIVALESARQNCVVIGEDLGTLPEGFHERMRAAGILSYRLLYFAQDGRGAFLPPRRYPPYGLVAIGTHDLATLPGFWRDRDLDLRRELGLYPSRESEAAARERRGRERAALVRAFKREGLLAAITPEDGGAFGPHLVEAAYRFLARTPARLLLLHIEDVLGIEDQANLPGTVSEHPNWRRKLSIDLNALDNDPRFAAITTAIVAERGIR